MKNLAKIFIALSVLVSSYGMAQSITSGAEQFASLYKDALGATHNCSTKDNQVKVCSTMLKNEGNAPFVLHHNVPTANVAILFHGLSDSPFFFKSIAHKLHQKGFNVIVPLLPGHGLKEADNDMEDWDLAERWQTHVNDVVKLAPLFGNRLFIGGFSTGGALATQHYLTTPGNVDGLMLFSGALALSEDAEGMSKIWGIKLIAQLVDGHYETAGPNPYKYPGVAGFAGMELMDVINDIRSKLKDGKRIDVPVYAAHSQDDVTTPISGVESLLAHSDAANTFFVIDKSYEVCHADVVVSDAMLKEMNFDESQLEHPIEPCYVPKANPLFKQMLAMLEAFVDSHGANINQ